MTTSNSFWDDLSCGRCCRADGDDTAATVLRADPRASPSAPMNAKVEPPVNPEPVKGPDYRLQDSGSRESTVGDEPEYNRPDAYRSDAASDKKTTGDEAPSRKVIVNDLKDTFIAAIVKSAGGILGLDLSLTGGVVARVTGVQPGPVQDWNEKASKENQIREGDMIVEVNGVSSKATDMLRRLREDTILNLVVKRRIEFMVQICKGTQIIGMDVQCTKNREGLLVNKVKDGAMKNWNLANPDRMVNKDDRIVEINGFSGEAKALLHKLKDAPDELDMRIVPAPEK